jgi:hypothetical protein
MKIAIAAAVLVVIALSGCSSAGAPETARVPAGSTATEPPAPEETSAAPAYTAEEQEVLGYLRGDTVLYDGDLFTDEELVAGARDACELFAQGIAYTDMDVVSGDEAALAAEGLPANRNDSSVAALASQVMCTDYSIAD